MQGDGTERRKCLTGPIRKPRLGWMGAARAEFARARSWRRFAAFWELQTIRASQRLVAQFFDAALRVTAFISVNTRACRCCPPPWLGRSPSGIRAYSLRGEAHDRRG